MTTEAVTHPSATRGHFFFNPSSIVTTIRQSYPMPRTAPQQYARRANRRHFGRSLTQALKACPLNSIVNRTHVL